LTAHVLDEGLGEEVQVGERLFLLELVAQGIDLVTRRGGDRLSHGDLLDVVTGGR